VAERADRHCGGLGGAGRTDTSLHPLTHALFDRDTWDTVIPVCGPQDLAALRDGVMAVLAWPWPAEPQLSLNALSK
jgi:hypothetical protein